MCRTWTAPFSRVAAVSATQTNTSGSRSSAHQSPPSWSARKRNWMLTSRRDSRLQQRAMMLQPALTPRERGPSAVAARRLGHDHRAVHRDRRVRAVHAVAERAEERSAHKVEKQRVDLEPRLCLADLTVRQRRAFESRRLAALGTSCSVGRIFARRSCRRRNSSLGRRVELHEERVTVLDASHYTGFRGRDLLMRPDGSEVKPSVMTHS